MGHCQVKIIFQNNLLSVLNKHLRLDKLHGFCLITFPQLILFFCQCLTSIRAQTDPGAGFSIPVVLAWSGSLKAAPCTPEWLQVKPPELGFLIQTIPCSNNPQTDKAGSEVRAASLPEPLLCLFGVPRGPPVSPPGPGRGEDAGAGWGTAALCSPVTRCLCRASRASLPPHSPPNCGRVLIFLFYFIFIFLRAVSG